jgi:hypothetical protein
MPRFSDRQLNQRDINDVASYVISLDVQAVTPRIPFSSSGPVPEGLLGWLAVGTLVAGASLFSRARPPT